MESFDVDVEVDVGTIKRGFMLLLAASHKQNSPRFVCAVNKLKRIQLAAECLQARAGEWERQWQWDWGMGNGKWRNASQRQTNKQATKRADRTEQGEHGQEHAIDKRKINKFKGRGIHPSTASISFCSCNFFSYQWRPKEGTAQTWTRCAGSAMGITTVIGVISCLF